MIAFFLGAFGGMFVGFLFAAVLIAERDVEQASAAYKEVIREHVAENAKLRELVCDMWSDLPKSESCEWDMDSNTCTGDGCIGECSYWYRMRELGIEVD